MKRGNFSTTCCAWYKIVLRMIELTIADGEGDIIVYGLDCTWMRSGTETMIIINGEKEVRENIKLGQIMEERPFVQSLFQNRCQNVVQSTHNYPAAPHECDVHAPLIISVQCIKQRAQILSTFADLVDWAHYCYQ